MKHPYLLFEQKTDMNKDIRYFILLATLSFFFSCETEEQLDVLDIEVPDGYALSAGTSTSFFNSPVAYDQGARWLSGAYDIRFNTGD